MIFTHGNELTACMQIKFQFILNLFCFIVIIQVRRNQKGKRKKKTQENFGNALCVYMLMQALSSALHGESSFLCSMSIFKSQIKYN